MAADPVAPGPAGCGAGSRCAGFWPLLAAALAAPATGCSDPARDRRLWELGAEAPGVPAGPEHRPGQPCVLCHDGSGPGRMVFSLAGTVYQEAGGSVPARDVLVYVFDEQGRTFTAASNCAGNFMIQKADFEPVFPILVTLRYADLVTEMRTQIFREGSCAACHADPAGPLSAGPVYVAPVPFDFPAQGCP